MNICTIGDLQSTEERIEIDTQADFRQLANLILQFVNSMGIGLK